MYQTVITLKRRYAEKWLDSQHAHTMIYGIIGERGLWAQLQPGTLVVQHARMVDWSGADRIVKHSYTTQVGEPPQDGTRVRYAIVGNPTYAKSQGKGKRRNPGSAQWCSNAGATHPPTQPAPSADGKQPRFSPTSTSTTCQYTPPTP